ncbi:MAG: helix-turn-helix domain-containing protein, partial [bacterium]
MKRGYKASTKMIASEAGISEGSLFKHFKTKQDLFVAAMEADVGGVAWADELMKSAGSGDMRCLRCLDKCRLTLTQGF